VPCRKIQYGIVAVHQKRAIMAMMTTMYVVEALQISLVLCLRGYTAAGWGAAAAAGSYRALLIDDASKVRTHVLYDLLYYHSVCVPGIP